MMSPTSRHNNVLAEIICPLTNDIMMQPVVHERYGYSCEQSAMEQWVLKLGQSTCPLTGLPIQLDDFLCPMWRCKNTSWTGIKLAWWQRKKHVSSSLRTRKPYYPNIMVQSRQSQKTLMSRADPVSVASNAIAA